MCHGAGRKEDSHDETRDSGFGPQFPEMNVGLGMRFHEPKSCVKDIFAFTRVPRLTFADAT
jgi:hypothetical protein